MTRLLVLGSDEPEVAGLLAPMLLHDARREARIDLAGALVPLHEQHRGRWDETKVAEGVRVLQAALARGRHGEYQLQAAIAALHDDARTVEETDWPQILAWYDELVLVTDNRLAALTRAVAVAEVHGPHSGLQALDGLEERLCGHHRLDAGRAHLLERSGDVDVPSSTTGGQTAARPASPSAATS